MKNIKGFCGRYKIDEFGNVFSFVDNNGVVKDTCVKVLKADVSGNYKKVRLSKEKGKYKWYFIHRLVYENFVGDLIKGLQINHIDENTKNNHYTNLEQVTTYQNNKHSSKRLGWKLTEEQVIYIRTSNESSSKLALKFNVSQRHIQRIRKGERQLYVNPVPSTSK